MACVEVAFYGQNSGEPYTKLTVLTPVSGRDATSMERDTLRWYIDENTVYFIDIFLFMSFSADEEDGEDNDDDEDYHPNDDIQVERTVPYSDSDESDEELVQRKPKVRKEETNESLNWTKAESKPKTYDEFTFAQPKGMTKPVESSSSPIAFVSLLITTSLLEHIVSQSNLYATQSGVDLNTSLEEMKAFLGLLIITGFHSLPSMFLYWSSDLNCHVEVVSKVMAVKRFRKLMRYIHLNDNAKMPARDSEQFDKLYKVRPIIVHFNKVFLELFKPSRFLSIDESMIAFKGRSSLKQYMPLKPIKRGFKVWVIACAVTGYCLVTDVYTGKSAERDNETPLGDYVVLNLSKSFEMLGYCLFFDNFFNSINLLHKLLQKNLFACGTFRSNRKKFPNDLLKKNKDLKRGEYDSFSWGEISAYRWKDRGTKAVNFASNMHNPADVTSVQRKNAEGDKENIPCPKAISDYNMYMGGVDRFDQLMQTYSIGWRSKRWWLKIFYYYIDAAIVNSYIMYKHNLKQTCPKTKPMSHLQFRSLLATELINNYSSRQRPGPSAHGTSVRKQGRADGRVMNIERKMPGKHLPVTSTRRRCAWCSTKRSQKRTSVQCKECKVGLCIDCFVPFHT